MLPVGRDSWNDQVSRKSLRRKKKNFLKRERLSPSSVDRTFVAGHEDRQDRHTEVAAEANTNVLYSTLSLLLCTAS